MKGIIFDGESVRAILDGRKTQMRRVITTRSVLDSLNDVGVWDGPMDQGEWELSTCRYQPGDVIYVKETWAPKPYSEKIYYRVDGELGSVMNVDRWKSPLHLPERFSRIKLRITDVRVQRLQDISKKEAKAEGVPLRYVCASDCDDYSCNGDGCSGYECDVTLDFEDRWNEINAKRGFPWDSNPWVWAISFERMEVEK